VVCGSDVVGDDWSIEIGPSFSTGQEGQYTPVQINEEILSLQAEFRLKQMANFHTRLSASSNKHFLG
jgi:hypothetical protein